MQKRVYKKQFIIESRRTGNRLLGHENELLFEVFTADGKKLVKSGFYKWKDANKWLSETVKIANLITDNKGQNT